MPRTILGISAYYHDSAAALVRDGRVIAAAQEERFSRTKNDARFPSGAVRFCLEFANVTLDELDAVVFYDKPFLTFERLLETYYRTAPRGIRSFLRAMPVWLREKLFLKRLLRKELRAVQDYNAKELTLLFTEHHLAHAASTFFASPFAEAAILTMDGGGEWATASISHGTGRDIRVVKEVHFPHSLGLLYSAFTHYLGFRVNSGEYKLMGLAPYGDATSEAVARYEQSILDHLVDLRPDGSLALNQRYFNYATGLTMTRDRRWEKLFGFPRRLPEQPIEQHHKNLALAIQRITEQTVLVMAREAQRVTGARHLCLAGGVALNCVANGKLLAANLYEDIFVQPAAGDAGGALGASLAAHHIYFGEPRQPEPRAAVYLGPEYAADCLRAFVESLDRPAVHYADFGELCVLVARKIAQGKVIGWFQERMEFGPRALGNRSILADPRHPTMQRILNLKIKNRESFRPFAPAVLAEDAATYFELDRPSPHMLFVAPVRAAYRTQLPAVTHVDGSARIQTVTETDNRRFWSLLCAVKRKTGVGMLINTSFNVRDEPIVATPEEAYRCFLKTEMDALVLRNYWIEK